MNLEDFVILRGNFGHGVALAPAAEFASTTPEPATMEILALGGLATLGRVGAVAESGAGARLLRLAQRTASGTITVSAPRRALREALSGRSQVKPGARVMGQIAVLREVKQEASRCREV